MDSVKPVLALLGGGIATDCAHTGNVVLLATRLYPALDEEIAVKQRAENRSLDVTLAPTHIFSVLAVGVRRNKRVERFQAYSNAWPDLGITNVQSTHGFAQQVFATHIIILFFYARSAVRSTHRPAIRFITSLTPMPFLVLLCSVETCVQLLLIS
jgi:hypothetical protein